MNNLIPIIIIFWIVSAIVKGVKKTPHKTLVKDENYQNKDLKNFTDTREYRSVAETGSRPDEGYVKTDSHYDKNKKDRNRAEANIQKINMAPQYRTKDYGRRPDSKPVKIAKRINPGDTPPQGMYVVKCPYCNADNAVMAGGENGAHCYFCWVALES